MLKKIARHILIISTIVAALALLWSALTAYISARYLHILAFAGFLFPIFWGINFIFVIVNAIRLNWVRLGISAFAAIITLGHLSNSFQFNGSNKDAIHNSQNISIMSFNVRMFDYYKWTGRQWVVDEMLNFIQEKDPDIICFQEFFTFNKRPKYSESYIFEKLNQYPYHHIEYNIKGKQGRNFGMATFSKFPIIGGRPIPFEKTSNAAIQTDVQIDNKVIRILNNHLESVRLKSKHYNFLDSINLKSEEERKAGIKEISTKLSTALQQRSTQAEMIAQQIKNSPYPVFVCGDFNDTPVSYVYHTMRGHLKDAFCDAGSGFGGTYNGKLPSFRIDFIFFDDAFEATSFQTYNKVNYSDHFPIEATIKLE